jgi:hypothetical protein
MADLTETPPIVVIKNRMFENWLVADVEAVKIQRARFRLSTAAERSIVPNKADNVAALEVLKTAAVRTSYSKVPDSQRILERADIQRIAANSRSFRRLLRVVGHPGYAGQSRLP